MENSEKVFLNIIEQLPGTQKGKMFGAACIKSSNGKVAAVLWQDSMIFKLDDTSQIDALKLEGAIVGSHLYNYSKLMNGWISIPFKHSNHLIKFTKLAIKFVNPS